MPAPLEVEDDCVEAVTAAVVDAIYADYETPQEHDEYIHKNYEYFGLTAPAALFKRS